MRRQLMLAFAFTVLLVPRAAAAQTITLADVNEVIDAAVAMPVASADPFSPRPASSLSGRPVRIEMEVLERVMGAPGRFTWSYDLERQALEVSAMIADLSLGVLFEDEHDNRTLPLLQVVYGVKTGQIRTRTGLERRSNAYGVQADVSLYSERIYGVGGVASIGASSMPPGFQTSFYRHTFNVAPDEARSLVGSLRVVFEGVVVDLPDGRPALCGSHHQGATLNNPMSITGQTCFLNVRWDSVAFVTDAAIMARWPNSEFAPIRPVTTKPAW